MWSIRAVVGKNNGIKQCNLTRKILRYSPRFKWEIKEEKLGYNLRLKWQIYGKNTQIFPEIKVVHLQEMCSDIF